MRISFFIGSLGGGGAERVVTRLANHFSDIGWDVDIIVLLSDNITYALNDNITIVKMFGKNQSYTQNLLYWLYNIRQYLKKQNPDRVVSFVGRINALVLFAGIGLKKQITVSERNDPLHDGRSKMMLRICDFLYKNASTIVFQTKYQRNCFSEAVIRKSCIIPNPVTVSVEPQMHDKYRVVTVGRLCQQKNQALLIDAAYKLKNEFANLKFEIYGDGELHDILNKKIEELDLGSTVKLMGYRSNIHECIRGATIFVLTSLYEGASNALIEAMMLGLPCICTDYPGADEIVQNGYNGIIVPKNDMLLARTIKDLLENHNLCQEFSHNAIISAQRFKADKVLSKWKAAIIGSPNFSGDNGL